MADDTKKRRDRSPNYPAIDLETAIKRVGELYREAKMYPMPVPDARKQWGYETSTGNLCIAALRAYGLAETEGSGDRRKIKITDAGRRITLNSPDRPELIQAAAVKPSIHAELWNRYKDGGMPPNSTIRAYLVFEREGNRFNESVVDGFIERFRDSILFAKLSSGDIIEEDDDNRELTVEHKLDKPGMPPGGTREFPLYLSPQRRATIVVPNRMTREELERFKDEVRHTVSNIEATTFVECAYIDATLPKAAPSTDTDDTGVTID